MARPVNGTQLVCNLRITDRDGSIQLALWNKHSTSPVRLGNKIKCSHVTVKNNDYLHELSLATTGNTKIEVKLFL